jgi:hypothetical protein
MQGTISEWLDNDLFRTNADLMAAFYAERPELGRNPWSSATTHDGGADIYRAFVNNDGEGSRYTYDTTRCRYADGWRQYDTTQDAWYFGVWYHPERRVVVTYAEGDETVVVCRTDAAWRAELAALAEFYGDPPPAAVGISLDGTITNYFDADARPEPA